MRVRSKQIRYALVLGATLTTGGATAVLASVDASGPWFAQLSLFGNPFFPCHLNFDQSGGALSVIGDCLIPIEASGTIDVSSGEFSVSGASGGFCDPLAIEGTVSQDATTFTGTLDCWASFTFDIAGSRCGNGALDASEACDDGSREDNDCCSASCRYEAEGIDCSGGNVCLASTCDGAGTCMPHFVSGACDDANACTTGDACVDGECHGTALPDGSSCDDGDPCTQADTCQFEGYCIGGDPVQCGACEQCVPFFGGGCQTFPAQGCKTPAGSHARLRIMNHIRDEQDLVSFDWSPGADTELAEFGNPLRDTSYTLCVFEGDGSGRLLAKAEAPAGASCNGKSCWTSAADGYRYVNDRADGVRKLILKAGPDGEAAIRVRARGATLGVPPLPASMPVLAQVEASNGSCWEAAYFEADRNGPRMFKARTDVGEE